MSPRRLLPVSRGAGALAGVVVGAEHALEEARPTRGWLLWRGDGDLRLLDDFELLLRVVELLLGGVELLA